MNALKKLYHNQFGTVCEELRKNRYIGAEEYAALRKFEDTVPYSICAVYRFIIAPVVAIMRLFPTLLPLVNRIARAIWINYAVSQGRKLL